MDNLGGTPSTDSEPAALSPARFAARRDAAAVLVARSRAAQLRAAVAQWLLATTRAKHGPGAGGSDEPCSRRSSRGSAACRRGATAGAGVKPQRIKEHPAPAKRARVPWLLAPEQQARLPRKRTGLGTPAAWGEHLAASEQLCEALSAANVALKPSKCSAGFRETKYLGFVVFGPSLDCVISMGEVNIQ
eukprot:g3326.t1